MHFVLKLPLLGQEVLLVNRVSEVFVVLSEQVELANVPPRIKPVTEWVLSEEPHVFTSPQQEKLVDLALEVFPVKHVGKPCEAVEAVEKKTSDLPAPTERIHEKDVPRKRDHCIVHDVGVLQVNGAVLDVVAREEKQLSVSVKLDCLRRLVNLVSPLQILRSSLCKLCL